MNGGGWHGWLWRLRFTELQAEMAVAQGHHPEAEQLARQAIQQSRSKHRAKYETYARVTLARALAAQGKKADALAELQHARAIADRLANPALEVMVGGALLATEPDEDVALSAGRASSAFSPTSPTRPCVIDSSRTRPSERSAPPEPAELQV